MTIEELYNIYTMNPGNFPNFQENHFRCGLAVLARTADEVIKLLDNEKKSVTANNDRRDKYVTEHVDEFITGSENILIPGSMSALGIDTVIGDTIYFRSVSIGESGIYPDDFAERLADIKVKLLIAKNDVEERIRDIRKDIEGQFLSESESKPIDEALSSMIDELIDAVSVAVAEITILDNDIFQKRTSKRGHPTNVKETDGEDWD